MSEQLTDKQEAVLAVIERHWRAHGVSPSVAEIAERLGLRKSTTHEHLMAIKRKGALVHVEGQSRSWRPTSVVSQYKKSPRFHGRPTFFSSALPLPPAMYSSG